LVRGRSRSKYFSSTARISCGSGRIQQHQAHQGEIAEGTKAAPELGDLFGGEGHDDAPGLL
jgi:hypothetical protein